MPKKRLSLQPRMYAFFILPEFLEVRVKVLCNLSHTRALSQAKKYAEEMLLFDERVAQAERQAENAREQFSIAQRQLADLMASTTAREVHSFT